MSDHINAVFGNMYLFVTIYAGKTLPKGPDNRHNINVKQSQELNRVFQNTNKLGTCPLAYVVKEQVCLDALLAFLSGKNHRVVRDAMVPRKKPHAIPHGRHGTYLTSKILIV